MRTAIDYFVIAPLCFALAGCSQREQVGGGYTLVTPPTMGPDHHPGTSLRYRGRTVWGNVFGFYPDPASKFYHDGIFVFVANVPGDGDWWIEPQLFAVRGVGPPVVLSERVFKQPLVVSDISGVGSTYSVRHLVATESGVSFVIAYWPDHNHEATATNEMSWASIGQMLDEAVTSARLVSHPMGDYRVLPLLEAAHPGGSANRGQPVGSQTNRTSAAAGSGG